MPRLNQTSSQMQFLQVVCVVLVMATLIGLITAYILYRDVQNLRSDVAEAKSQADRFRNQIRTLQEDMDVLKTVMGYEFSEVGRPDDLETSTIVGKVQSDINHYVGVGVLPEPTLRSAIVELHTRWQDVSKERNALKASLDKLSATMP